MMRETGFTQLGKRFSAQEKRDYARRIELSVLCINISGQTFRMPAFERTAAMVAGLAPLAELILVDLDAAHSRNDLLLAEYPWMRVIIPTREIGLPAALFLGMREALGQRVLVLDTATAIAYFDIPGALRAFREERRLFAIGPSIIAEDETECPVVLGGCIEDGRLQMTEAVASETRYSLALRRFYGLYDREKVLFLGTPPTSLPLDWAVLEWFISAWSRGWRTVINPEHCFYIPGSWPRSVLPGKAFVDRVRFYRYEIGFLRRHCRSREQVRARRRSIFRRALTNLLKLDFSLALAGLTHNRLRRLSRNTLCSLQDVFMMASADIRQSVLPEGQVSEAPGENGQAEEAIHEFGQAAGLADRIAASEQPAEEHPGEEHP